MSKCELCGRELDVEYAFCPFCGEPQHESIGGLMNDELRGKINAILHGTERRLQAIIGAFSRYIEAPVVDSIVTGDMDGLRGVRRNVTVLFSDIRNSSGIVARVEPEQALELLNHHHDRMAAAIQATDGVLDKFMGDGMLAFYTHGEPSDHARQAVNAALQMREYVAETNQHWPLPELPLRIGVAINNGEAVIGSVGSRYRQDYTAIGAEVNYIDDLQEMAKQHAVDIVISHSTYELVADDVEAEEIGMLKRPPDDEEEPAYHVLKLRPAIA